jgi:hypothetical protein
LARLFDDRPRVGAPPHNQGFIALTSALLGGQPRWYTPGDTPPSSTPADLWVGRNKGTQSYTDFWKSDFISVGYKIFGSATPASKVQEIEK